jgi:uracil-DNA glycosylase
VAGLPKKQALTPYQAFRAKWAGGCGAEICLRAESKCFARGYIPCHVLCIAEAPGVSEDVIGEPLVGPAGHLFDHVVSRAVGTKRWCTECLAKGAHKVLYRGEEVHLRVGGIQRRWRCDVGHETLSEASPGSPIKVGYTNALLCIPRDADGEKMDEPPQEAVEACGPRLREFIALCSPALIVCVGAVTRDWLDQKTMPHLDLPLRKDGQRIAQVAVTHPAAILRAHDTAKALLVQRSIIAISNAIEML